MRTHQFTEPREPVADFMPTSCGECGRDWFACDCFKTPQARSAERLQRILERTK